MSNASKKIIIVVSLTCFFLTGCFTKNNEISGIEKERDTGTSSSTSTYVDSNGIPSEGSATGEELVYCSKFGNWGNGNGNGYYYTWQSPDGNYNIKYLDYATQQDAFLCNKPNCDHEGDYCTSWIGNTGCWPIPLPIGDKLYIIHAGSGKIYFDLYGEDSFPHIEMADLNGENRTTVYQMPFDAEWYNFASDGQNIIVTQGREEDNESMMITTEMVKINLQSGEMESFSQFKQGGAILNAYGKKVIVSVSTPKEDATSLLDTLITLYSVNIVTGETTQISQYDPKEKSEYIENDVLYRVDLNTLKVTKTDLSTQEETTIIERYTSESNVVSSRISYVLDNKIIIDDIQNQGTEQSHDACTVVDADTGETSSWPFYYEREGGVQPNKAEIFAVLPDQYLLMKDVTEYEKYLEQTGENAVTFSPNLVLIAKDDFWAGTPNFSTFSAAN